MNIDNLKKFIQENYKLIIPISLIAIIFISFFIYYNISVNSNFKKTTKEEVYQYFYGKKYEYSALLSKDKKNVITEFKPIDIDINLDATPIYLKKNDTVIFPQNMSVIMPTLNCSEYLSLGYSYISLENNRYILTTKKYSNKLNHYFFYDGGDLYFFIEPVTLTINKESVALSSYSYVIAKYNGYISYYDKKTDTFKTFDNGDNDAKIENEYYSIYISRDTIDYQGTDVILTSSIEELNTIDKKG